MSIESLDRKMDRRQRVKRIGAIRRGMMVVDVGRDLNEPMMIAGRISKTWRGKDDSNLTSPAICKELGSMENPTYLSRNSIT
jgi:hypothetical protein